MKALWNALFNLLAISLALLILPAIIIFLARETFLWQGTRAFKNDLRALNRMSTSASCEAEYGLMMAEGEQMYKQLRFTSSRAYELELICPGFPDRPLAREERVLSSFISKQPGSAGVLSRLDVGESYVAIVVFQELVNGLPERLRPGLGWISRGELIGMELGEIKSKPLEHNATLNASSLFGSGPVSTCEGYGFTCCNAQTQFGMGDAITNVPSCPANCYSRCVSRPLIVSWRSNPMVEWGTDVVVLPEAAEVVFFYVLEDSDASGPWTAKVDFGDGEMATVEGKNGSTPHTYSCATERCEYTAAITITNALGAQSAQTELSQIKVSVGAPPAQDVTDMPLEPDQVDYF